MPTYRNNTSLRPLLDGRVVEPKSVAYSTIYYDEDVVGLRVIDEKPYYNPILISTCITKSGEILIPKKDNLNRPVSKYSIHLYLEKGMAKVNYNALDNEPGLILYNSIRWNTRHFQREVERLIVNSDEDFILFATVERLP